MMSHFLRISSKIQSDMSSVNYLLAWTPFETFLRVKNIIDIIGIDMEMHTHNDFGMAIANAIAGIKAGATYVNTTINGLGERAGNAAFPHARHARHEPTLPPCLRS